MVKSLDPTPPGKVVLTKLSTPLPKKDPDPNFLMF